MTNAQPLQESDVIFNNAATADINHILGDLKRSNLSIGNRLRSIRQDSDFAEDVADAFRLPLVANERCGSWYVPPWRKRGSAYFKSTDGHTGQWAFSLRRLNLQVLNVVQKRGGCVIVDSTRRGKSMPDALSKTVPIWIAVLNTVLFPDDKEAHVLHTPPTIVTASEHAQIEARLDGFVQEVRKLQLDLPRLKAKLSKPLLPVWITPGTELPDESPIYPGYHPVLLCTVSRCASSSEHVEPWYVQGAADDSESWAAGLNARRFWMYNDVLLCDTSEGEYPATIAKLMSSGGQPDVAWRLPVLVKPTTQIFVCNLAAVGVIHKQYDIVIACSPEPSELFAELFKHRYVHLACTTGKVGSRQLRHQLRKLTESNSPLRGIDMNAKILIADETGKDLAVGVALAVVCLLATDDGQLEAFDKRGIEPIFTKAVIKQRLSWISVSMPQAAPSRATLQSVNAFLMD